MLASGVAFATDPLHQRRTNGGVGKQKAEWNIWTYWDGIGELKQNGHLESDVYWTAHHCDN